MRLGHHYDAPWYTCRFPLLLPILSPEYAVGKIMAAFNSNQTMLMMPRILYLFYFLQTSVTGSLEPYPHSLLHYISFVAFPLKTSTPQGKACPPPPPPHSLLPYLSFVAFPLKTSTPQGESLPPPPPFSLALS